MGTHTRPLLSTSTKGKMKTQKQIDAEIETLKSQKPRVPNFTAFGDDNWAAIDVQIEVLEKEMDQDAIDAKWPMDGEYHFYTAGCEAMDWRDEDEDAPSKNWKSLVK